MKSKIKSLTNKCLAYGLIAGATLACAKEYPNDPLPEPEVKNILAEQVNIVSQDELDNIVGLTDSTITFSDAMKYSRGDILIGGICDNSNGFLRKVESIDSDGRTLKTSNASLEDVILDGGFEFEKELKVTDLENHSGTRLGPDFSKGYNFHYPINDLVIYDLDKDSLTTNDQVILRGDVYFNATAKIGANFKNGIEKFYFETLVEGQSDLEVEARLNLPEINEKLLLYQQKCMPISIPTPIGIPIIFRPDIQVYLGVEGSFDSKVVADIGASAKLENELVYENGGWNLDTDFQKNFEFKIPEAYLETDLKAYVSPRIDLILYESLGPYCQLEEYLKLNVNTTENPWWTVSAGNKVKIGVDMGPFSKWVPDYEKTVYQSEEVIGQAIEDYPIKIVLGASPLSGDSPLKVDFDLLNSQSVEKDKTYLFNFGKGEGTYLEQDGNSPDGNFDGKTTHVYKNTGTYLVTGTIIDSNNQYSKDSLEIKVSKKELNPIFGTMIDPRDNQEYKTVTINNQTWTAENMNCDILLIPYHNVYWWDYNNDPELSKTYGKLYGWQNAKYACPTGWHLPSVEEFSSLIDYLGGPTVAGGKMKEAGYEHWKEPNEGATNESGFGAVGSGAPNYSGGFGYLNEQARFWTSTKVSWSSACEITLNHYVKSVNNLGHGHSLDAGKSVRCIQDK